VTVAPWTSRAGGERQRLQQAPEIPILIAVTNSLDLAVAVLRIQHPFLAGGPLESTHDATLVVRAEVVRLHALALRAAIEKYRETMPPFPYLPGDDDDDFF
jgi:hypothetical protein